jgi:periplasmic protein TonB
MPRETQGERIRRVTNSRVQPRVKVHSLAYVELGDGNAGLILNISETGMAIQAVQMLASDHLPKMQFRLPKTETLIEASGNVIWQIRSKKEAGIHFSEISDNDRAAIRAWIAAEQVRLASAAAEEQRKAERLSEAQSSTTPYVPRATPIPRRSSSGLAGPEAPASARNDAEADSDYRVEKVERAVQKQADGVEWPDTTQPERANGMRTPADPTPATRRMPTHWRGPANSSTAEQRRYGERIPFERPPAGPRWHGRMAPGVGMEIKKSRRWLVYTVTLGLLAAVGFAGLMAIDPGLISRAQIDGLTQGVVRFVGGDQSTANQTNSAPAQSGATAANSNPGTSTTPVQPNASAGTAPPVSQPSVAQQGPAAEQPMAAPESTTPKGNTNQPPSNPSSSSSETLPSEAKGTQPSQLASRSENAAEESARDQSGATGVTSSSSSSNNERASQPPRATTERSGVSPSETARPPASFGASRSRATGNQPPARTAQDAYARYANAERHPSSASPSAASPSDVAVVEMSSYQSSPVPPSVPLAGMRSGSVAATSRLRAIRIPAELDWARPYLPNNLGVGRLLSSYSPAYPIAAARKGIQGTVKLDVIVGTDGTVRSVQVVSGPAMLSAAAVSAVRDWRYAETFLAGRVIETEQDVAVVFRLASPR